MQTFFTYLSKFIAQIFILFVKFYQYGISPYLGASKCRYTPTCSQYAIDALRKHGCFKGLYLATKRILSCRPGGGHGLDQVPD